ncbi:hypothetical protein ILUMI_06822 [Ignelater luminosus]|uniref:Uncharacterized protein n=1 Tax=Ignelater luminosus TaxID=2038154 RepID=A0A8K0GIN7_IGNLU|nr:hypothetical protein ILUMI_06822 [Ignelater luminosus]
MNALYGIVKQFEDNQSWNSGKKTGHPPKLGSQENLEEAREKVDKTEEEDLQEKFIEILNDADRSVILSAHEKACVEELKVKFSAQLQALANRGATSKFWVQYFEMVTLVKLFIGAKYSQLEPLPSNCVPDAPVLPVPVEYIRKDLLIFCFPQNARCADEETLNALAISSVLLCTSSWKSLTVEIDALPEEAGDAET